MRRVIATRGYFYAWHIGLIALAIALALLAADEDVALTVPKGMMFLAELGLDGRLRPVPGVLPAVVAAAEGGMTTAVVAAENEAEAALVPGVRVVAASSLMQVMDWLRGGPYPLLPISPLPGPPGSGTGEPAAYQPDLSEVLGQVDARRALEISAAGGHNLSLLGPPGTGKTMLAERLPLIMPQLDSRAALEVTSIHSVAGRLQSGTGLISTPPFCAPHHTATKAAIVGGGSGIILPGAASLAHRGVLFLDEAPEFSRDVLDALRQPLEAGEVTVARLGTYTTFPARFTLVLASNPCPCAMANPGGRCTCSPITRHRYLARLSGPLLDRIDVKVKLEAVSRRAMLYDRKFAETSEVVAKRVALARERALRRLEGTPWRVNAEVPGAELRRTYPPEAGALRELDSAMERGQVTARGVDKIIRVAWSVADLAGRARPGKDEIHTALSLWLGMSG